ncbi:metallophosphoesterase family protein [Actinomadura rupiterrae]|uniref:metallophosphoesterase family protein n=1 Tax=Actinomadura rupiterrae TaxID=559627 RepID=UPI0020A2C8D4|nr:metallophosphoesterase [Actinomadura rupiterrae]MCP2341577.1 Icc-related predicted phosphoesterase [Actinomadura rupiterrae]
MIRVAAFGDVHVGPDSSGTLGPYLAGLSEHADVLLVAGDLTRRGTVAEGEVAAAELACADVPVIAVLGNHDHSAGRQDAITALLQDAGIRVLEGTGTVIERGGVRLGVAGGMGSCGGFPDVADTVLSEPELRALVEDGRPSAERLGAALDALDCEVRVALTHYAPVADTLAGERLEVYPFLGSHLLGEAIDGARRRVDLAVHGHAHYGSAKGLTPGGTPVRNVALPVLGRPYALFHLAPGLPLADELVLERADEPDTERPEVCGGG